MENGECPLQDEFNLIKLDRRGISATSGFKTAGVACGIKTYRKDLALIYSDRDSTSAGVFTQNKFQAAPVQLCRSNIKNPIRAVVVNSGNANACTGGQGLDDAREMAEKTADMLKIRPNQIMVCSTGIIGITLPMDKIRSGIGKAANSLGRGADKDQEAAEAILTTDRVIKQSAYRCSTDDGDFHVSGIAKGSGMICPDMATMLAFISTDISIEQPLLQRIFSVIADKTFNAITVDGDTSTNDTAIVMANGAARNLVVREDSHLLTPFTTVLEKVCQELALQIVEDGEGMTKVIELTVHNASDEKTCRSIARKILNSPLVKTAFFGEDANFGRIIASLGSTDADFDPCKVDIFFGPFQVAKNGEMVDFNEEEVNKCLHRSSVNVVIDLKNGEASGKAWGTDLTYEYIKINAGYRS